MIAIEVKPEYRFITRSLFGWGSKGELNALIIAGSEVTDFFEGIEAGPFIGLVYVSYRGRARV
jgi:hypothetical protein